MIYFHDIWCLQQCFNAMLNVFTFRLTIDDNGHNTKHTPIIHFLTSFELFFTSIYLNFTYYKFILS